MLEVVRITKGGSAENVLLEGDLLVQANGEFVTRFADIENLADEAKVVLSVLRNDSRFATRDQ